MHPELPGLRDLSPPWLERLASLWPGRTALVLPDKGEQLTYADLLKRSRSVAHGLAQRGVGRGDRVAAIMENGVEMLDLFFACGRLGAIFAPLNWRLSRRETAHLIEDVEPRVVVGADLAGSLPGSIHLITTAGSGSDRFEALLECNGEVPPAAVPMADPWLILYTGGTTGTPKGALLTHGSISWNAINTTVSWGLSDADVGPSFTPMFHTGAWNVFTLPLLMLGARVILPERFEPGEALRILEAERPTVLFMVPTMYGLVSEQPGFEEADLSSLRWAISGGAPLPDPIYQRWSTKVRIFKQGYGLTEVGPNNFATPDDDAIRKRGTVGRLTYFAQARIVDDGGVDLPAGTPGELLLAGPHMCAGYWRQPEATEAAMGDGWFHTGDVARCDDEGYYYIVDRKKDMIISGGENVYPAEVEAVLYEHPAVREAAVVGLPHPVWGEAVTAVVSLRSAARVAEDDLRRHMREGLAGYKVPKTFVIVPELPKSPAGKIVRAEARRLALTADR